jgi:hypothetical protein
LPNRAASEQRRLGLKFLEIAADGDGFGDHRSVVELQDRQAAQRVARGDSLLPVFQRRHVDGDQRHHDPLLGQEYAHASGIGSATAVEKLHRVLPSSKD